MGFYFNFVLVVYVRFVKQVLYYLSLNFCIRNQGTLLSSKLRMYLIF